MGGGPCGGEDEASRHKEDRCQKGGGEESSGEGGEEDFASKEIGGEEIWTEEDGPDCCTGRNGNRYSVALAYFDLTINPPASFASDKPKLSAGLEGGPRSGWKPEIESRSTVRQR